MQFNQVHRLQILQPQLAEIRRVVRAWLEVDQIEERFFRRSNKSLLPPTEQRQPVAVQQAPFDVTKEIAAQRRIPPTWMHVSNTDDDRRVLRDHPVKRQRRLTTDVRTPDQVVGDHKGVRLDLLKRGRQGVQSTSQLIQLAGRRPARQLLAQGGRIDLARNQQPRFEQRFVANDLDKLLEFHDDNIPQMVSYCNEFESDRGSPAWWNQRYQSDDTPWDTGIVPPEVHELVDSGALRPPGAVLDLGCGTGTNSAFLARLGFVVFGVDLAVIALQKARTTVRAAGLPANFCAGDVADLSFLPVRASFALDIGCLHSLAPDDRARYAASLAERLESGALYLMYGFDQGDDLDSGPAGFATSEVAERFAPRFELLWRRPSLQGERPVAWYLLRRN